MDRACACLKSVRCIGVDKDHRTSNWVLIVNWINSVAKKPLP